MLSNFPRVQRWLETAGLPEDHEAQGLSLSDPIVPALEYFLSLEEVPGFEERLTLLEKEPAGPPSKNTRGIKWASHCAEIGAICLLGQELGLRILGFDQRSPRATRPDKNCDVAAEVEGSPTFFEVKRRSVEDLQIPPPLLRARLLQLDLPYSLSVEMIDPDYDCGDLDERMEEMAEHLVFMHDPDNKDLWWQGDTVPPAFPTKAFIVWFHEKDKDFGLVEHFEPASEADIKSWLRGKTKEASEKGADYLTARVPSSGPWGDLVNECFDFATQDGPRSYSVRDAALSGLRGLILFSRYDRFCIVNDRGAGCRSRLSA
jgi:hypothetical protein